MNARLLYLVNDPSFFLSHRLPIARKARDLGCEVHVVGPMGAGVEEIVRERFLFHCIPIHRNSLNIFRELNNFLAIVRLFSQIKPDLVHTITIKPVIYGGIAARLAGVPALVSAITGLGYVFLVPGLRGGLLRAGVKQAYKMAFNHPNAKVIFQNPDDNQEFLNNHLVSASKGVLIKGAGVDMKRFSPKPEPPGPPMILLALRMLFDKGVVEFIEAARQLRAEGVTAKFVLVGDADPGNPATIGRSQLQAWHDEGIVEWWGKRADMPEIFAQSHVVCLPSYREGIPKVLIEAAACGRAIVATNVPGCREVVRNQENGLLVPVKDSGALANALRTLIEDAELRARFGQRGREIAVAEFSEEKVVAETLLVYSELLKAAKQPD